jgi:hypothetical protein
MNHHNNWPVPASGPWKGRGLFGSTTAILPTLLPERIL